MKLNNELTIYSAILATLAIAITLTFKDISTSQSTITDEFVNDTKTELSVNKEKKHFLNII